MYQTHGDGGKNRKAEYAAWNQMIPRCCNPKSPNYHRYGGRGISVCSAWRSYEQFLGDVGRRPSVKHSLDRFPNNNGNYEPGNVRWATRQQQARNQRTTRFISALGLTLPMPEWAERQAIKATTIKSRIDLGWSADRAVSSPVQRNGPVLAFGKAMTLSQWSAATGIKYGTIYARLNRGWRPEKALTTQEVI